MNVYVPAGSVISLQTAIAASQSISSITKANPAVITYSGNDPANNDYMVLSAVGMTEFNGAVVKVSNVNAGSNTFEALDQDSTYFENFVSGGMEPVTFGAQLEVATGFSFSGGDAKTQAYTLLKDKQEFEKIVGYNKVSCSIPCIWDPEDAGMKLVRSIARAGRKLAIRIKTQEGLEILFQGEIGASGLPTVQNAQSIMETSLSLTLQTLPTYVFP